MKIRELLIAIPVHKDRLTSLSRPFAVLQMVFCRFSAVLQMPFNRSSAVLHMSFNRSSCRPLLSFRRLSTCHQSFLLPSLCYPSVVSPPTFNRSSCRLSAISLLSFSRLSTYLQSFLLPSLCHLFAVLQSSPPLFILLSAVSGQCGPTSGHDLTNKNPRRPFPVCRGVYGSEGECYSPLRFMRYL